LSVLSAIISTNNKTKGQKMTLEEYKEMVIAQREASKAEALALLSKAVK
jgi:hypothetical protein